MIDKIYLFHYKPLKERLEKITPVLDKLGIPYEIVSEYDKEELSPEIISKFYYCNPNEIELKQKEVWGHVAQVRELNLAEISLTIKHFSLYEKLAKEEDGKIFLLLEDDAVLAPDFLTKFNKYLLETPKDWEMIWLGLGCGWDFWNQKTFSGERISENVYKIPHPASNCSEAILIKPEAARKLTLPFMMAVDWELAWQIYEKDIKTYWWTPLVEQGSKNGQFKSELR